MAVERTLSIIKPDAVAKNVIGEIYARFEKAGLKIVAARMAWLSRAEAEGFYAVHQERPFFRDLVEFMTSGPVMIQVLEGDERDREEPRADGRHRSEESGRRARSAPISRNRSTPTPCTAPTRRRPPRVEIAYFFPALAGLQPLAQPTPRDNLLDLDPPAWQRFFAERGEKPFRARQVSRWVHQRFVGDIAAMTDLAKALRDSARRRGDDRRSRRSSATRRPPTARASGCSTSATATPIETVYIPEDDRGTLCISSQAGCALDCAFCSTGKQGFNRNLTTGEIIGQLWHANRTLLADGVTRARGSSTAAPPITNVVMMGMGEPLANFDNVVPALRAHARRQRVRAVAPPRDAVDVRPRAADRPPARRVPGRARRVACTRPTTRCATGSCRSTASIRSPS